MSDGLDPASLLDDKELTRLRNEAEKKYQDLTADKIDYIKRRCKTDLFFLANGPLEYSKLTTTLHGNLTRWIQKTRGKPFRLELLPRGHYKSVLLTVADSVQIALPNIANVQEYPYCLGPQVKILIGHEVRETAADFLYLLANAFTRKPLMLALWPECIPTKGRERVNKWELDLPTHDEKEATFNTIGAGGAAQGGHYNWLKLDDLIGEAARDSPTVMKTTLQWFDNILSLTTDPTDGFDLTGTRWAFNDVYSHAMERYGIDVENSVLNCLSRKDIKKYGGGLLQVYARGVMEGGLPIFPEVMTPQRIKIERQNPLIWASQYANNPIESGLNEFSWGLKFYNVATNGDIVVFSGESSFRRKMFELDICVFCDPSMGQDQHADETGIVVTGVDSKANIFILETVKKRLKPPQLIDELHRIYFRYHPRLITIEEVNFSAIYRYWIEEKSQTTQIFLPIRPYKPGSQRSKEARIRGLAHFFSAGQVYISEGMHDFRDEYEQFPLGKSQHLLDALAQGPEFWTRGADQNSINQQDEAVEQMYEERSVTTGY